MKCLEKKKKEEFVLIKMKMTDLCCLINGGFCQRLSDQLLLEKTLKTLPSYNSNDHNKRAHYFS